MFRSKHLVAVLIAAATAFSVGNLRAAAGFYQAVYTTGSWTYDATAKTISDGDWVLKVETDVSHAGGLKVTGYSKASSVLDFSKTVSDSTSEYVVLGVKKEAFRGCTSMTELYLPEGFYEIGNQAFNGCTSLKKVSPLLPDSIKSIGSIAFYNCPIEGDLRLGFGTDNVSVGEQQIFYGHHFSTITIGSKCTKIVNTMFATQGNSTLKQVTLHDGITSWGQAPFYNCSALTNITPCLPSDVTGLAGQALSDLRGIFGTVVIANGSQRYGIVNGSTFNNSGFDTVVFGTNFTGVISASYQFLGMSNLRHIRVLGDKNFDFQADNIFWPSWSPSEDNSYKILVHVPADNVSWQEVLADSTQVTPWAQLDAATQAKFATCFPNEKKPKGLIVANWSTTGKMGSGATLVNRWITDDTSDLTFTVVGKPENAGAPSIPYGVTKNPKYPLTCTMAAQAGGRVTYYETLGCSAQKLDANGDPVGNPEVSSSLSYTCTDPGEYSVELTWNFGAIGYKADVSLPKIGSYSVTTDDTPDFEGGYFLSGRDVTYTANGEGFVRWYGEIGDADPTSRSITVRMDSAVKLVPYFAAPWVLSTEGAKTTMSDGYATLNLSGSGDNLVVASFASSLFAILDLSKPIVDSNGDPAGAVTEIAKGAFNANTVLEELYLPETLVKIGDEAFLRCTSLKKVSPLLPDSVASVGSIAFYNCPIEGDLRLGFGTKNVTVSGGQNFYGHHLTTITLGENCKVLTGSMFATQGNSTLKQVTLHDGITSWGQAPFYNCSALTNITPCLPSDVTGLAGQALSDLRGIFGTVVIANGSQRYGLVNGNTFYNSGFDTVVFGTNFTGVISASFQFVGMNNFRYIRVLGDANFDFQADNIFWPSWSSSEDNSYKILVNVPVKKTSWQAVLNDKTQVTPWAEIDDETKAKFYTYFPNEKKPKGLIVANWSTTGKTGSGATLVNRWITYDALPGFSLIVR